MRVCFPGQQEMTADNKRQCYANTLGNKPVRIHSLNRDSGLYTNWIAQIILAEVYQTPVYTQEFNGGKMSYYPEAEGWEKVSDDVIMQGVESAYIAIERAFDDPHCETIDESQGCVHMSLENWAAEQDELEVYKKVSSAGITGVIGQLGWYIPSFIADRDLTLLSYKGLVDGAKMQAIFKRPLTVGEACGDRINAVSADVKPFCVFINAHAPCSSGKDGDALSKMCSLFLVDLATLDGVLKSRSIVVSESLRPGTILNSDYVYVAAFLPDHVKTSDQRPAGYMAGASCDWTTYDHYIAAQHSPEIQPVYTDPHIIPFIWEAAVIREEGVLMYDWTTSANVAKHLVNGDKWVLSRVSMFPWNWRCEKQRPLYGSQCDVQNGISPYAGFNDTDNGCDYPMSILWKSIPKNFNEYYPRVNQFVHSYVISTEIDLQLIARVSYDPAVALIYPKMGERRQNIVCQWIDENKQVWSKWVPPELFEPQCLNGCSGHGTCVASSDQHNPTGLCTCDSNHRGADCSMNIPNAILSPGSGKALRVASVVGLVHSLIYLPWVVAKWKTPLMMASMPLSLLMIIAGAVIGYSGVIIKTTEVMSVSNQQAPCSLLSHALISCSISLILATLLYKSIRITRVFNANMQRKAVPFSYISRWVLAVLTVDGIIFICWSQLSPSHRILITPPGTSQVISVCDHGSYKELFTTLILLPKLIMVLKCCEVAYNMQKLKITAAFNETKVLGFIIYNVTFVSMVIAPIGFLGSSYEQRNVVTIVGVLYAINVLVLAVFAHKMRHVMIYGYSGGFNSSDGDDDIEGAIQVRSKANNTADNNSMLRNSPSKTSGGSSGMKNNSVVPEGGAIRRTGSQITVELEEIINSQANEIKKLTDELLCVTTNLDRVKNGEEPLTEEEIFLRKLREKKSRPNNATEIKDSHKLY